MSCPKTKRGWDNVLDQMWRHLAKAISNSVKVLSIREERQRRLRALEQKAIHRRTLFSSMSALSLRKPSGIPVPRGCKNTQRSRIPALKANKSAILAAAPSKIPKASKVPTPTARETLQAVSTISKTKSRIAVLVGAPTTVAKRPKSAKPTMAPASPCLTWNTTDKAEIIKSESPKPARAAPSNHAHYARPHMGQPCTAGAIDHLLKCGHKVITAQPETCAQNCHQPKTESPNPRSLDQPYVCMTCVIINISKERTMKWNSYYSSLMLLAKRSGREPPMEWIREKLSVVDLMWRELDSQQIKEKLSEGRFCQAVHVDEDFKELVNEALSKRNH